MTAVPSPDEQLLRSAAMRTGCSASCSSSTFPAALGLAVLHGTWLAAILVGGGVSAGAYFLAQRAPGAFSTRAVHRLRPDGVLGAVHHQSDGLIEMHFHFFGALAFLLVYRDWRVIVVAAAAIAVHHLAFMVLQDAGAPVWVDGARAT